MPQIKPYFIAEVGINHGGDFDKAVYMIEKSRLAGANAAKFQFYNPEKVLGKNHPALEYAKQCQFTRLQHEKLARHCERVGLEYAVSVFDLLDVAWASSLSAFMKVASRMNTNLDFIQMCLSTGKPVFMSIQEASQRQPIYNINYMWCQTQYPSNPIDCLNHVFDEKHGLSSHCPDWMVSWDAYTRGARLFENHVCESREELGCDISSSITFHELSNLTSTVQDHYKSLVPSGR
jgi:sialic acid synthase SpsE